MLLPEEQWMQITPDHLTSAFAPFPRSIWIHPQVPIDYYDRVCKKIWERANQFEERYRRGQSSSDRPQNKRCLPFDDKQIHGDEEQPKDMQRQKTKDLSVSTQYKDNQQQHLTEFTLPCPYLSCNRHPHVTKPALVLNAVMEKKMKLNNEEAERKRNLDKAKRGRVEDSRRKIWVPESRSNQQSCASEQQTRNQICYATEEPALCLLDEEDPPLSSKLPRDTYEIEDEQDSRCSSDISSSDADERVTLLFVQSHVSDNYDNNLVSDIYDLEVEENKIPYSSDDTDSKQEASSAEMDFPPLSAIRSGVPPCPVRHRATGKVQGQWEIPLSFHPHNIPTETLARGLTAPLRVPVQSKETPQAKTNEPLTVQKQRGPYDLLADFPALQPPERPLALAKLYDRVPKTNDAKRKGGLIYPLNHSQGTGTSQRRRKMEKAPHQVSSICAGAQKSVLDLQTFSTAELKANKGSSPRVAGTDGMGVNARSWASVAKEGMKQAAAPKEKARPCILQQIVTINRAKVSPQ
ncbi:hypothetical protein EXN66_Car000799 [Channa argus]|uniref:Uncharacterized protein n=1 Tax=Channa argus TaxID=215402 RepID=A0A6G1QZV5_CHAAH|nr:hypothetical protein EXN66_Car000799 [Channa argus]